MSDERELLRRTAEIAADFVESLDERPVWPPASVGELRRSLGGPLPEGPIEPMEVIEALCEAADPGVVGIPSGRYFGFVIGGGLPAALAADWLASTWDQNAGLVVGGPSAAVVEEVAGEWLKDLLGIPCDSVLLVRHGVPDGARDVPRSRTPRRPRARGLGRRGEWSRRLPEDHRRHRRETPRDDRPRAPPSRPRKRVDASGSTADSQGRMRVDALDAALRDIDGPAIVCAQAGEVNTGAFDSISEIASITRDGRAWLHVDGAFGLWVSASPRLRHLAAGVEQADSWATDAHKWLNVPYDNGLAFVAHPDAHRAAMRFTAEYLVADPSAARDQMDWTPEFSRRARGFAVYAALRSLGRSGVADLVERSCARARRFADAISTLPGCELLSDVVLNQVLFRFADDETTGRVLASVQSSGEAWMSGTTWDERAAIRLSVSNWRTTEADIDRTVAAFERALAEVAG